jgi:hypothetical protein
MAPDSGPSRLQGAAQGAFMEEQSKLAERILDQVPDAVI